MGGPGVPERERYLEQTAHHVATLLYAWDASGRSAIRKRVQELLRCTDEPATITIAVPPRPLEASLQDLLYAAIYKADEAVTRYDCPEGRLLAYLLRTAEDQRRLAAAKFNEKP